MNRSRADLWTLAACLAGGLLVRVVWLDAAPLWSDEAHTLHTMELPTGDIVAERLRAGHLPLYFLLLKAWTALFGTSGVALRMPSALIGTAALVPAWMLLRRLLGEIPARWGTALLAIHPLAVELSREARMYPLLALVLLVLAESCVAALGDGRVRARFWAAAIAGPCVHASWAFAVPPIAAWLWIERRQADALRRRAATLLLAGVAGSLVLLTALLLGAQPQHQVLTRRPWPRELLVFVLRPYLGSKPEHWFPTGALAAAAWAAVLWAALRACPPQARRLGVALLVGVPLASCLSGVIAGVPWGPARYVQAATIGAVVLAASVLAAPGERARSPLERSLAVGAFCFVGVTSLLLTLVVIHPVVFT